MPCKSDYLEATGIELESIRVCKLIIYLYTCIDRKIPQWVLTASKSNYGNVNRLNEATKDLCCCCRGLNPKQVEAFIYNAHSKEGRKLAGWWERHQEWDERRIKEEEEENKQKQLRAEGIDKLTTQEMRALGLLDS